MTAVKALVTERAAQPLQFFGERPLDQRGRHPPPPSCPAPSPRPAGRGGGVGVLGGGGGPPRRAGAPPAGGRCAPVDRRTTRGSDIPSSPARGRAARSRVARGIS